MTPTTIFFILILIIVVKYLFDTFLDTLNAKHFKDKLPIELENIYDKNEYEKSQNYKKVNYKFGILTTTFSVLLTLLFFFLDGFVFVNDLVSEFTSNQILITILFFGVILLGSDLLSLPFSYYKTFVIEEKFGFNKR